MDSILTSEILILPKEKTYFRILLVISLLTWLVVVITIIGLIYGLLIAFFIWLFNGLLVARIKSEAVQVTSTQLPSLYTAHLESCQKLGLQKIPELYIMQSHGMLNAFATRHSGRDFVVIYSDLLEALGHDTAEVRFLIGHEIGHIQRKHLLKHVLLLPGSLVPLLGKAYSRACEATCDRFGAYAAVDLSGAVRAMVALAAGKEAIPLVNAQGFAEQYYTHRGFFVSWHELNSTYPTLAQRTRNLLGLGDPAFRKQAERHPLSYVFALFTLSAGSIVALYLIFIISLFAGLAVPTLNGVIAKAMMLQSHRQKQMKQLQQEEGAPLQTPAVPSSENPPVDPITPPPAQEKPTDSVPASSPPPN